MGGVHGRASHLLFPVAVVAPVPSVEPRALKTLRRALSTADFTADGIQKLLGTEGTLLASRRRLPIHRRRALAGDGPLGVLVSMLVLGLDHDAAKAEAALGTGTVAALDALRLVEPVGSRLRPISRLVPHEEILIASDLRAEGGSFHVPGVQPPSTVLARLTVRRPVERALDVGTGCGIQAILASRHSERVVATDVSERALAFAEFNLALNGIENVDLRRGSFLDPVEGERFGLAVANPPYVVSPESDLVFRDSGLGRDRVSEELVAALPAVLEEGGFGTVMISWIVEGELVSRPREWAERTGCAVWLFNTTSHDALGAAEGWNRDADTPEELEGRVARWLDYYAAEGIESLAYGCAVLRRAAPVWFRSWELPDEGMPAAGPHVERLFANGDLLQGLADEELLGARIRLVEAAELVSRAHVEDGEWRTIEAAVALADGLGFRAGVDAPSSALVIRLDGSRPLREVFAEAAEVVGMPADE
ncbi:MAG: class I SAM-dependent methyltransferase, partial [Gaiellaceae bacterium]